MENSEPVPVDLPSASIPQSRIGIWRGVSAPGDVGIEVLSTSLTFSIFEIPMIPDLSSSRFTDLSRLDRTQRTAQMGERINKFLDAIYRTLGAFSAVSLRYFVQPQIGDGQIRLFLIGRSCGPDLREAAKGTDEFREVVRRNFPSEYRLIERNNLDENDVVLKKVLYLEDVRSIAELLKPEQLLTAWHKPEHCGFSFYYVPRFFEPAANDMVDFCRSLMRDAGDREAIVDICLVPTGEITEYERMHLGDWKNVCDRWGRSFEEEIGGGLFSEPVRYKFAADPHAQETRKVYDELLQRYGTAQHNYFLYSIRALWWQDEPPISIVDSLASYALSPGNNPQTFAVSSDHPAFTKAVNAARFLSVTPTVCRNDIWDLDEAPETIRRLHRMVDLKEISGFFRMPIAGRDGCPGFLTDEGFGKLDEDKASTAPVALDNELWLGNYVADGCVTRNPAKLPLKELNKHCLIVGMPGSGKTTLCFALLKQLWETYRIPFIVLEPAKTEYRGLQELPCFTDDLLVFTVGSETVSPFRFNPFEVPVGIPLAEHISTLKTCFSGAFNLADPLPMILERALTEMYTEKGWSEFGGNADLEPPTMEELLAHALRIADESSYRGDSAGNIRGALEQRLGSLTRGVKGRCFNTKRSIPFDILMSRPVVLELDALNDDEKALLMMFVLSLVRATAKIQQRERKGELSHVVLVEEAHNVVGRAQGQGGSDRANPQEVSIKFFTRMLAEMRAWGEGIIIADQLPTSLAPEAVKNTKIKIMHKVVSADDRTFMGETMNLDPAQFEQAVSLPPGQSLYFSGDESRSRLILEPNVKAEWEADGHIIEPPPDDESVRASMLGFREQEAGVFLPYEGCPNVCRICDLALREEMERLAEKQLVTINKKIIEDRKTRKVNAAGTALQFVTDAAGDDEDNQIRVGCAFVHYTEKIVPRLEKP